MRILFLTQRLPYAPNRGDRLRAWHELQILGLHHEITLVSLVHDADEAAHATDLRGVTRETIVAPIPRFANRARAVLALPSGWPLTHVLLDSSGVRPALQRLGTICPPDVVLAYCSSMARFAMEPPLDRFPLVIDMVDADSAKWGHLAAITPPPMRWVYAREARLLGRFEATAMRRACATLVVNERERQSLLAVLDQHPRPEGMRHDSEVLVVGNGIEVDRFAPPGPPADQLSVVFCGTMSYVPNEAGAVWLARDVWPLVRAKQPDATLWLVGAGPTAAVRSLASSETGIKVTGTVDDVRPFLWSAAVSVAPLHTARGVQNKVLEAVAAGLPAVVTSVVWDGLPVEVRSACLVADTPQDFGARILALLRMSASERRAVSATADLSPLSWRACLAPLVPVLEEAANAGRA